MWQKSVAKLLAEAGWGSGFRLPISNAENLRLEKELEKRQSLIHERKAALEDADSHIAILEKALKNAKSHIFHDRKLVAAKQAEVKAEAEISKLGEREIQRYLAEYKLLQHKFKKSKTQNRLLIDELDTRKKDLTELADLIEYDRQALASIERKASDDDQIMAAIEEICDQDAETLRQYDLRYRKAASDTCALRRQLEDTVGMTRFMQSELDGLIDRFRKLHKERSNIVSLWKSTLNSLSLRDEDMKFMGEEYEVNKATLEDLKKKIEEKEVRLDQLIRTTNVASTELSRWDRKVSELRNRLQQEGDDKEELKAGVLTQETIITVASSEIQDCRRKSVEMTTEISELHAKVHELHETIDNLKRKLEDCSGQAGTATDRWLELKAMVDQEQKRLSDLEKQLQKETYLKSQWLVKVDQLNGKVKEIDHELKGVQFMLRNVKTRTEETKLDIERRNALIYKIELHQLGLKSKIKPFDEPEFSEESVQYRQRQEQVFERTNQLENVRKVKNKVASDILMMFEMKRRMHKEKSAAAAELNESQEKSNVTRTTIKYVTKLLAQFEGEIARATVNYNLEKVKLHQLARLFYQKRHELFDAASYRNLLQSAMREKRAEIEAHCRLLDLKKRGLADANSRTKMEIVMCSATCKTRRQKYENYMKLMSKNEDVGTEQNEAYFIIKMAQERELLQLEGDSWDRKVKEAEKETAALQNSLSLIQCSNELFRDSLKPVSDDDHAKELESLKQHEHELIMRKTKALKVLTKVREQYTERHRIMEMAEHQKSVFENKFIDKQYELRQIENDISNQEQSLRRARLLTNRILHDIAFSSQQEKEIVSLDIRLKATRKKFEFSIQALARLLNIYPAIYDSLSILMSKEFGEQVATKFLKRVSPMIGDTSPTQSHRSRPGSGASSKSSALKGKAPHTQRVKIKSQHDIHGKHRPSIAATAIDATRKSTFQDHQDHHQERERGLSLSVSEAHKKSELFSSHIRERRRSSLASLAPGSQEEKTSDTEPDDGEKIVEDYDELLPKRTPSEEAILHLVQEAVGETAKHHVQDTSQEEGKVEESRKTLPIIKPPSSASSVATTLPGSTTSSVVKVGSGQKGQDAPSVGVEKPEEKAEESTEPGPDPRSSAKEGKKSVEEHKDKEPSTDAS